MLLTLLLAAVACQPPALPAHEARTPEVWKFYLELVIHDCWGHLDPVVRETTAAPSELTSLAYSVYQVNEYVLNAAVLVSPDFLEWATPEHIRVVLGHEAVHIALTATGPHRISTTEEEFAADVYAATAVPGGACLLSDVYLWHLARPAMEPDETIPRRLAVLQPLCVAQRALK